MKAPVHILFTNVSGKDPETAISRYLGILPESLQKVNKKYKSNKARMLNLFGKLLLIRALEILKLSSQQLANLEYDNYNRPFIKGSPIDFNISHSGDYVVCAISDRIQLGVDIECIVPFDRQDVNWVMTEGQWRKIDEAIDPLKEFYSHWTAKESVMKADSRGMGIPMEEITFEGSIARCGEKVWWIRPVPIAENYSAFLASSTSEVTIERHEVSFS